MSKQRRSAAELERQVDHQMREFFGDAPLARGLDARNGKKIWEFRDGEYNPLVADEERVYLVGRQRIYGMEPSE